MVATKELKTNGNRNASENVAKRKAGAPTVLTRIHADVDELADMLCGAFKKSKPDFISDLLRPLLEKMQKEGATRITSYKLKPPADS